MACSDLRGKMSVDKTVFLRALEGNVEGLKDLLNNCNEASQNILRETDVVGRNALSAAYMLGRSGCVRYLVVNNCADVNDPTTRGYSPLHYSAMWGQLDTLITLVELGADLQAINFRGERAVDVAHRYSKLDCADFLAWAEAKQSLQIKANQSSREAGQRGQGQETFMNMCINTCSVKSDCIQNVKNPTIHDFIEQKKRLEDVLAPTLTKLTAQL